MDQPVKPVILTYVAAIPGSLGFLAGQPAYMRRRGLEVHAVSSPGEQLRGFCERQGCTSHVVRISRSITPLRDLVSVFRLWRTFRRMRPHIVEAHMSKAGLLGTLAAWLARVPVRIYCNHGVSFSSARGWRKTVLRTGEWLSCALASQVHCVSPSVRALIVNSGCCPGNKIRVLAKGSCGVDAEVRFNPARLKKHAQNQVRSLHGIPPDVPVVGFVGRLARLKGVEYLVSAWRTLRQRFSSLRLLVVGGPDARDPIARETEEYLYSDPRVHLAGLAADTVPYYAAMDVLVLPSFHEGLPISVLEGSAMCLPVVASEIAGNTDAVLDGETGTLVPVRDSAALAEAIATYLRDPQLRRKHGEAGRQRVLRDFRPEAIWEATYRHYVRLLQDRGLPVPCGAVELASAADSQDRRAA